MAEIWRPVPGYEGYYEASDQGKIRGLDRDIIAKNGRCMHIKGRILKPRMVKDHLGVSLWRNHTQYHTYVHTIIALTFLGPRPERHEIRHLNGNIYDNRVLNLAYGTSKANKADTHAYGGKLGNQKLSVEDAKEIRRRHQEGESYSSLARSFGVVKGCIGHVINGRSFVNLPKEDQ